MILLILEEAVLDVFELTEKRFLLQYGIIVHYLLNLSIADFFVPFLYCFVVLAVLGQNLPSLDEFGHRLLVIVALNERFFDLSYRFVVYNIDNFFKLSGLNLLFVNHLPKAVDKPSLVSEPTILELSFFEFQLG